MNAKYAKCARYTYALMALAAMFVFVSPTLATGLADGHDQNGKTQLSDFDKMFSEGSLDWMLLLDQATLDNLKNMNSAEIDKLKQDMLNRLREMDNAELDRLRDQHRPDLRDRLNDMPPKDLEKFKLPWQEDTEKDHKLGDNKIMPVGLNGSKNDGSKFDDHKPIGAVANSDNLFGNGVQSQYHQNQGMTAPASGSGSFGGQPGGQMGPR